MIWKVNGKSETLESILLLDAFFFLPGSSLVEHTPILLLRLWRFLQMSLGSFLKKLLCWARAGIGRWMQKRKSLIALWGAILTTVAIHTEGQFGQTFSQGWRREMMVKQQHRQLTSDLILFARRAILQVSWGCTDCRWGRSWGVYSLSFVSLVKVAFCTDQQINVNSKLIELKVMLSVTQQDGRKQTLCLCPTATEKPTWLL